MRPRSPSAPTSPICPRWRPRSRRASSGSAASTPCVANAGIASYGSVLHVDPAAFRRVIDINVTGVFHTVRAALPHVIERRGYVLVVSSMAAFAAAPGMAAYNASKAGAEHFANALRLEVAHRGVAVGSAHMCWIDTPMVQEARKDLGTFDAMIAKLPAPLNRTTSVEACVDAFVAGIGRRSRRIYVPGWVGAIAKARSFVNSPAGERETLRNARTMVDVMDEEVAALGRSTSARYSAAGDVTGSGHAVGGTAASSRSLTSRASD